MRSTCDKPVETLFYGFLEVSKIAQKEPSQYEEPAQDKEGKSSSGFEDGILVLVFIIFGFIGSYWAAGFIGELLPPGRYPRIIFLIPAVVVGGILALLACGVMVGITGFLKKTFGK